MEAIHSHTTGDYEILVIDNGSEPRGYVWAANRGLESAQGDPIVVMNDDIIVRTGWLDPILEALDSDNELWICAPTIIPEPSCLIGPCTVWRREAYETIGGYSTKFIQWAADGELIQQIDLHNKRWGLIVDSVVEHVGNSNYIEVDILHAWHIHDTGSKPTTW